MSEEDMTECFFEPLKTPSVLCSGGVLDGLGFCHMNAGWLDTLKGSAVMTDACHSHHCCCCVHSLPPPRWDVLWGWSEGSDSLSIRAFLPPRAGLRGRSRLPNISLHPRAAGSVLCVCPGLLHARSYCESQSTSHPHRPPLFHPSRLHVAVATMFSTFSRPWSI